MTARQPRRARRRVPAASPLPRPVATDVVSDDSGDAASEAGAPARRRRTPARAPSFGQRTHHVTNDYSYVHRDLLTILGVTIIVMGFIIGMSFRL